MEGKAAVLFSLSFMLGMFDLSWAILHGFAVPAVFNTDPIHPRTCGRFPEGDEELRHAIENAFDNLNAVGIPDVDLIDPSGQFSFSLWGVTSDFDFDRTWLLHNNGNQMDWVPRPSFPGHQWLPRTDGRIAAHRRLTTTEADLFRASTINGDFGNGMKAIAQKLSPLEYTTVINGVLTGAETVAFPVQLTEADREVLLRQLVSGDVAADGINRKPSAAQTAIWRYDALHGDYGDEMKAIATKLSPVEFTTTFNNVLSVATPVDTTGKLTQDDMDVFRRSVVPVRKGPPQPTEEELKARMDTLEERAFNGELGEGAKTAVSAHQMTPEDFYVFMEEILRAVPLDDMITITSGVLSRAEVRGFQKDFADHKEEILRELSGNVPVRPEDLPGFLVPLNPINHCVRIGTKHGEEFIKSNYEHHELCVSASPICFESSTQFGTPYLTNVTGSEGGAEGACNRLGGQGVFEVKNNADMYRLWRHIYQSRRFTDHFWVHGFRTNAHSGDRISLDHYDEHGHNCGVFFSARPNQFTGGQVVSWPCDRPNVNYVCDDVHYIRYINYYHPTNDKF